MVKDGKIKHLGQVKKVTQKTSTKETVSENVKTREDYEENYKRAHIGLIAEFVRDAAGM